MGLIYRDAHISYAYASDTHSGSLPLSLRDRTRQGGRGRHLADEDPRGM